MDTDKRSDEPDDLRSIDQALLVALTGIQRDSAPLSASQEQLLDDWMLGRLKGSDIEQAARLAKHNGLAAEYIMERRLVAAAATAPGVPSNLSSRVLKIVQAADRHESRKVRQFRWPLLSILQWSAAGAMVAATLAAGIFGVLVWHQNTLSNQRVQLAMVTIDDRRALSGAPQYRSLRNDGTVPTATDGFRDVDVPADLLRRAIGSAEGEEHGRVASQLRAYLTPGEKSAAPNIAIDSVLAEALSGEWAGRAVVPVRAYNLDNARTKAVRERLSAQLGTNPQVLLTVRR